jgi:hypothetical protein
VSDDKAPLPLLSADEILSVDDAEVVEIPVPEWKGTIRLRVLPADEGLALSERMQALPKEKQSESLFMLLAAVIVGMDGAILFDTSERLAKLRGRSQKVLLRLQGEALKLQGWGEQGAAAAKNV